MILASKNFKLHVHNKSLPIVTINEKYSLFKIIFTCANCVPTGKVLVVTTCAPSVPSCATCTTLYVTWPPGNNNNRLPVIMFLFLVAKNRHWLIPEKFFQIRKKPISEKICGKNILTKTIFLTYQLFHDCLKIKNHFNLPPF